MPSIPFSKWSCGGNTTLFFPHSVSADLDNLGLFAARLMKELAAEQAGLIDEHTQTLRMAGDEFCLNATRAFGAELAYSSALKTKPATSYQVTVSGWSSPITVSVQGSAPQFTTCATLTLPIIPITDLDEGLTLVCLPGISHLLIDGSKHPLEKQRAEREFQKKVASRIDELNPTLKAPCLGAIWWEKQQTAYTITPLIYVRATKTLIWEEACGSGTLALALYAPHPNPDQPLLVRQPSGAELLASIDPSAQRATVSGTATLIARGTIWT